MLKTVRIYLRGIRTWDYGLVENILRNCKDLKSLKFCRPNSSRPHMVRRLVSGFAHSLEEIFIGRLPHGMRLTNLAFPKLKSLSLLDLFDLVDTILLLQNVGGGLEKIELGDRSASRTTDAPASKWRELFDVLRVNCPKLSSIFMFGTELPKEDYEQVLISYGLQLRYAGFEEGIYCGLYGREEFECMSRTVPYCPNVEFKVLVHYEDYSDSLIPVMNSLTPHITKIVLDVDDDNTNFEAVEGFANRLDKLKTMRTRCVSVKLLHAMFATPKLSLEELHLDDVELSLDPAIGGKMKGSVSNLLLFEFFIAKEEDVEIFASLLTACSNLRRVSIEFFFPLLREEGVDYCNRLLRAVRDCRKLEYVDISNVDHFLDMSENGRKMFRNEIIDAQLFRFRNIHIRVDGVEMLAPSLVIFDN